MSRNMDNRTLRQRFFGWIKPSGNDNFEISQLEATIEMEQKNLVGRLTAVAKYKRYAKLFKRWPKLHDQAIQMMKVEEESIPHIRNHIEYLQEELAEEYEKLN